MVDFSPLAAEIGPVVWDTPPNFNGFCFLAALLHGILVVGVSQTLRCWTEREHHLYSAGGPSRWALAHILVLSFFLAYSQRSKIRCLPYFYTWCGLCEFRMQVWNVLHAARWKYRMQTWRKKSPSAHHRTTLSGCIFATKACIDNRKKLV